ncbi:hypothetical protein CVD28_02630 [Bacillus sp. M6-12]|uniref:hypothetical protein n=1 Tax=Bacillus sp. M6-12 TaxID=2054166 RepID=UPI000C791DDC|nr:hypothetical protein [Bacillus sp. M6-12]PLS19328.1 hypothetical protein CVD28_02630 [Bacillus sp. M6-12]
MLADVTFPIFAPSKEWNKAFEESDYNRDETVKKFGSPFISNQHEGFKIREGIYYTGLNAEHWFSEANLDIHSPYGIGYEEAHKAWNYRKERDMKFISLFEIAEMYKLALYGDSRHVSYGVCDNEQQILDKWSHLEKGTQGHFITMTPIYKKHQPEWGGWRWHKWGEYIGNHEIEYEYLYDEKDIEVVYVFHIYTLKPNSPLGTMPIEEIFDGKAGEEFVFSCKSEEERLALADMLEDPYDLIGHGYNGDVFEVDYSTLTVTIKLKKDVDLTKLYEGIQLANGDVGHEIAYERKGQVA